MDNGCGTLVGAGDCVRPYVTAEYPDPATALAVILTLILFVWVAGRVLKALYWLLLAPIAPRHRTAPEGTDGP
jgi:hypothetical protein